MFKLRMSPLVRLGLSFQGELRLSPETLCTEPLYNQYLARRNEAEYRKNQQIKMLFILDAVIAVLLLGKSVALPFVNIQLSELPAALEVFTAFSASTSLYLSIALVNENAYDGILRAFNARRAGYGLLDPDFLTLGDVHGEIFLKVFKSKMNDHGADIYQSNPRFSIAATCVWWLVLISAISIFAVHIVLLISSALVTLRPYSIGWILVSYIAYISLSTLSAIALYWLSFTRFEFSYMTDEVLRETRLAGSYSRPSASFADIATAPPRQSQSAECGVGAEADLERESPTS